VTLEAVDFDFFRAWLRARSGIVLEPGKEYLVESRLERIAALTQLGTVSAVVRRLRDRPPPALELQVVEALTTNETSFFRDWKPFEALKARLVAEAAEKRTAERRLDLWSAACSSGQEAYSVAMLLAEHFPHLAAWDLQLHCTDLSTEMVERTRAGRFTQLEVNRGLPAPLLVKHFRQDAGAWQVSEALRRRVKAMVMNLTGPWPALPTMDLVLMRNVLIYFDVPTKKQILDRTRRLVRNGGVLFLGSAETTVGLVDGWQREESAGATYFRAV
jgi:chemotaxis protein methyltransferase CheR